MPDTVVREDHTYPDAAGITIHYSVWPAARPRAVVHLLHGLGEYAKRYEPLAQELASRGYTVYADDHRGHGRTGMQQWDNDYSRLGRLGPGGVRATVAAIRVLTDIAHRDHPDLPVVLLGPAPVSRTAQMILEDHAADYAAVVLTGTAYRTVLHMNSGDLNKRHAHLGTTGHEWLSRDVQVHQDFKADPLTFDAQAAKLFGIRDGLRLLARDLPMLIMIGEEDPLGGPKSVKLLAGAYRTRGGLTDVTVRIYPGARHEVFNETNRAEVFADLLGWLDAHVS